MTVRLADVAAQAGVSEATVSRVVNDRPGVSDANRRAVLTAMEVLGYVRAARRTRRAGLVGVIVPELENPVFPLFVQALAAPLARAGFTPVVCSQVQGGVHEDEYVRALLDAHAVGFVFVSGIHANVDMDQTRYVALRDRGVPIALVNGFVPGLDAPFFSNDEAATVELSVDHLVQLGHCRIGLAIGPPRYVPVRRRLAAFREAMRTHVDADLTAEAIDDLVETTVYTLDGGGAATRGLLARGVTAVIFGSDVMALGGLRACRRLGIDVPADLSVVGSDGIGFTELSDPPLTTVRQRVTEIGEAAAHALLDEIAGERPPRAESLFRPELVVRASTGPAPKAR